MPATGGVAHSSGPALSAQVPADVGWRNVSVVVSAGRDRDEPRGQPL
ncbi:hypothetical protein [Mycolicibacterium obuense]|nr:hypothetical protein [Mycolicibacterium obuense]